LILLDTHIVLWLVSEPARLSKAASGAIRKARKEDTGLAISDVTLLEIAALATKKRLAFTVSLESALRQLEETFTVLPITAKACAHIPHLPSSYGSDPASRIIGATAIAEGIPLVTADRNVRRSRAVRTIW
jgi:PIN domain nuclease of toxin-antitoxin system